MIPDVSISIASRNHGQLIPHMFESIFRQSPSITYEIVFVDDGSTDNTQKYMTELASREPRVNYIRLETEKPRNSGWARNIAVKACRGEILIQQSDEVVHMDDDMIDFLATVPEDTQYFPRIVAGWFAEGVLHDKRGGEFNFPSKCYYLGSVHRKHVCAIGGYSEDFIDQSWEDTWLSNCLVNFCELGIKINREHLGVHIEHPPQEGWKIEGDPSKQNTYELFLAKKKEAKQHFDETGSKALWIGGEPWPYPG